jgi:hypothetical protein
MIDISCSPNDDDNTVVETQCKNVVRIDDDKRRSTGKNAGDYAEEVTKSSHIVEYRTQ